MSAIQQQIIPAHEERIQLLIAEIARLREIEELNDLYIEELERRYDAEIAQLREALESSESWIDRWSIHVGRCEGDKKCTCGRVAILTEVRAVLAEENK